MMRKQDEQKYVYFYVQGISMAANKLNSFFYVPLDQINGI